MLLYQGVNTKVTLNVMRQSRGVGRALPVRRSLGEGGRARRGGRSQNKIGRRATGARTAPPSDTRIERAETRAKRAEERTGQAKTRTEQAETRTEQAETRTESAKTRTEQAEIRTEQAETRTEQAEFRTERAEADLERVVGKKIRLSQELSARLLAKLTNRQRETLRLIAEGQNTKTIADILKVSPKTVEYHRMKLMDCLNIHDVPGLVRLAMRADLLPREKLASG
jgi:DNA-binding CsgD family transcriptional regulator